MKLLMNIVMATAVLLNMTSCGAANYGIEFVSDKEFEGQYEYEDRILEKYSEYLGPTVLSIDTRIQWVMVDQCDDVPGLNLKWNGGCYNGIAFSTENTCDIILAHRLSLRASSLAHELLHCSLHNVRYEQGDPEHTHPLWKEFQQWR